MTSRLRRGDHRRMRQLMIVFLSIVLAGSVAAQRRPGTGRPGDGNGGGGGTAAAGEPLRGLTAEQREAFDEGHEDFVEEEDVIGGLGPLFNERSCVECHNVPAAGGGSARLVTRFARRTGAIFDPLTTLGGSLVQDQAIGPADGSPHAFRPEVVPPQATVVVKRRSTPLFGLGLVDATPDATFIALAQAQLARGDGTAGRAPLVDNFRAGMKTVGRFGWKGQVPTLLQFSGDAYLNELGVTSADFPNESCPQGNCAELAFNPAPGINDDGHGVAALAAFMATLAPPPRGRTTRDTAAGEDLFTRIGCAGCHVPSLRTGSHPIRALDQTTYQPYSDFLLHDMGALGDGLEMGAATGNEMRTAPLWGLRFVTTFLHDGRATTLDQAILAHDGQGRAARNRFAALPADQKAKLLAFLRSL